MVDRKLLNGSLDDIVVKCLRDRVMFMRERERERESNRDTRKVNCKETFIQFKLNVIIVNELIVCFKGRFKRIHRTNSLIKVVATEGIP